MTDACIPSHGPDAAAGVVAEELAGQLRTADDALPPDLARLLGYLRTLPRARAAAYLAALREFGGGAP